MKIKIAFLFISLSVLGIFAMGQTVPPPPPPPAPIKNGRIQKPPPPPGYNNLKKEVKKIKFPKLRKPTNPPPPPGLPKRS